MCRFTYFITGVEEKDKLLELGKKITLEKWYLNQRCV